MNVIVLIPAYNPDEKLTSLVSQLSQEEIQQIVIINDGSNKDFEPIFEQVDKIEKVILQQHPVQKGKGAALKTGLNHIRFCHPDCTGVITADADGQHSVKDILKVARTLTNQKNTLVMGSRQFTKNNPVRSLIGNVATIWAMRLLFGLELTDTQTGLRAIPISLVPKLLEIPYNKYEFEMEMLLVCKRQKTKIIEIPIETIYIDNNITSHFNPFIDSMRIYFVLFRYTLVSIISAFADCILFASLYPLISNIMMTAYASRLTVLFLNYILLKNIVFYSHRKVLHTFPRYITLVAIACFISSTITYYLNSFLAIGIITAKIIAELLLYPANFLIQKDLVFEIEREK